MVVATDKTIDEHIREELSGFPESEEKEDAISLAVQMVENENYTVGEAANEIAFELKQTLEKAANRVVKIVDENSNTLSLHVTVSLLKDAVLMLSDETVQKIATELKVSSKETREAHYHSFFYDAEDEAMNHLREILKAKKLPIISSDCVAYFPEDELSVMVSDFVEEKINFNYKMMIFNDEILLKIVDIDYDEGLDFDDVSAQIPTITTDNAVVTDGEIVRYTAILSSAKSLSVFYDKATGEYAYNGNGLTKLENDICEDIGIELKKSNGNYETLAKRLTAVEVDKDVFENMSTVKTLSDELVKKSLSEKFGASFMGGVDLVMWDRTVLENRDYKRVGIINNGVAILSPDYQDDYDAKLYAECMGATSFYNQERSIHDIAQSYNSEEHGKIEDILASNVPVKNLEV